MDRRIKKLFLECFKILYYQSTNLDGKAAKIRCFSQEVKS